jgi:sulfonate transport system ATP-binding protein
MAEGIRIRAEGLSRIYRIEGGTLEALRDVSLELAPGSATAILGRNGGGKTTLLRLLAGADRPDAGRILFLRGETILHRREIRFGPVFQEPRLLPWLNVERNLAFALEGRLPADRIRERVGELLELLGLPRFRSALPHQLSGGLARKVALGRALAREPEVLLLDEPFASLDRVARGELRRRVDEIRRRENITLCLVTHDIREALEMGETLLVMESGRIVATRTVPGDSAGTDAAELERRLRELLPDREEDREKEEEP